MSAGKLKLLLKTTTFTHFHVVLPGLEHRETRATRHRASLCENRNHHRRRDLTLDTFGA